MERKAVNLKAGAQMIGVHPHTLKRLIAEGRIGCVRVGRRGLPWRGGGMDCSGSRPRPRPIS